jgi:hypothetical protein
MRACSFAKLVIVPSNATISPSAMKEVASLLMNRFDHLGIFRVQPNPIPRKEIQIATTAKNEAALPIPFRLKQPSLSRKDFIRERRQHGRNPFRLGSVSKRGLGISRQSVERVAPGHRISPVNRRVKASECAQMSAGWASKKPTSQHFLRLTRKDPIV